MTKDQLDQIEARHLAASKGPWTSQVEGRDFDSGASFIMTGIKEGEDIWSSYRGEDIYLTGGSHADQDFIAHARQDIPMLLAEIRRLQALTSQHESDLTGEQSGHLAAAGNTIAPMYFLLIEKGYKVNRKDEKWRAKKGQASFIASDLLQLGGLVLLFEHKGNQWRIEDEKIHEFIRRFEIRE